MQVVVIGAGIVGVAAAHALIDEGHAVMLVDPADEPGRACDGNAGWIAHTDILPLASPKAWRNLPRWLADPLGPLAVRPAYLPRLAPWLTRFAAASRPQAVEASTVALRELNALALPAWQRRLTTLGLDEMLRERGILSVWTSRGAYEAAQGMIARQQAFGIPVEPVEGSALRALEPALGEAAVIGALYPSGCHVADPKRLTAALAERARERGAAFVTARALALDATEDGVAVRTDRAGTLTAEAAVVAAGAWSKALAASLGDRVPLDTERGYNATFPAGTFGLTRPIVYEGEGFVTTPLDTGDRVGGAVEFAGLAAAPNHARTDAIIAKLKRFLPDLDLDGGAGARWMGFRPSLPDSLPVIGRSRRTTRVVHAFGHGHYGLTQSAATAEIVAALIGGRAPPLDPAPFAATRF